MYHAQARNSGSVDALQTANPEFQIRVDRIFHQHGHIQTLHGVGQFLHGKRVGHCACSHPEDVDSCFHACFNVARRGHFGGNKHTEFFLHARKPRKAYFAHAFKSAGFGAGFPDAGTQDFNSFLRQLRSGVHYLFFCLGRARTGNHDGSFIFNSRKIKRAKIEFHCCVVFFVV